MTPTAQPSRIQVIDAFRGIAILAVMAYHYTVRWPEFYGYSSSYSELFRIGQYGVHLFFVVSGLVITIGVTLPARMKGSAEEMSRMAADARPAMTSVIASVLPL